MVIYTGLLNGLDLTDDEFAQVIAHEVSHALLSHGAEKASVGLVVELLGAAAEATGRTAYHQDLRRQGAEFVLTGRRVNSQRGLLRVDAIRA